jgi:predicted nucleotidyltransferase
MEVTMNRSRALELLTRSKPTLAERYGVTRLALFGSTARDAARPDSDIDKFPSTDRQPRNVISASSSILKICSAAPLIW